jgi:peptidoglycan hydrolase CwlO-like protein
LRFRTVSSVTLALVVMAVAIATVPASAQNVTNAERELEQASRRVDAAQGLVDEAVTNRAEIEMRLAESIARASDLAAALSEVGSSLDSLAGQVGHADAELAGIAAALEEQAVESYMERLGSPTLSIMTSDSVEQAMFVSTVVSQVVNRGRAQADELFVKRRSLEELQQVYLSKESEFADLKAEMDAEVEELIALYEEAEAAVADAVRRQRQADADYRNALSAVDLARARQDERERQADRPATTTTTVPPNSPTTTTAPATTTTRPPQSWDFPPQVERWRSLVTEFFPASRVDEALAIIRCESNGDPNAYNPYSGASGLFQFLPSTWATTAPRAGYPDASPFEPEANTASAAWLANRYEELGEDYWRAWSCRRVLN